MTTKVMKSEKDVKAEVIKVLRAQGDKVWYFMPVPNGMGTQGIPDFIGCVCGHFFGVETKFDKNGLTPWQIKQMGSIRGAKGTHFIINETNISVLESWLNSILAMNGYEAKEVT
jgi:hypothetical protein